jgi:hypothetical protein
MPERYLHLIAQLCQTFLEQKGPIVTGFFTFLFIKAAGFFTISGLEGASGVMHFLAAIIEYLLGLLSAISVALVATTATHFYKKYLNKKHPIK